MGDVITLLNLRLTINEVSLKQIEQDMLLYFHFSISSYPQHNPPRLKGLGGIALILC